MATVADVRIRSSRRAEAFLLALAVAIAVAAYALVGLGATGGVPANVWFYGIGTTSLALAGHVALRAWARAADPVLFPAAFALNGVGLAMIYRLDLGGPKRAPRRTTRRASSRGASSGWLSPCS